MGFLRRTRSLMRERLSIAAILAALSIDRKNLRQEFVFGRTTGLFVSQINY